MPFWEYVIWENTVAAWLIALGVAVLSYLGLQILKRLVVPRLGRWAARTEVDVDNLAHNLLRRTRNEFLLVLAIFIGAQALVLPVRVMEILRVAVIVACLVQAAMWGLVLIDYVIKKRLDDEPEETRAASATGLAALGMVAKVAMWSVVVLLVLENITGIKVDALIASLGIGGIAVALAVQNILGDLFASLTIALDKPFVIGDAIRAGEFSGTVEHIGLKSTRLRSLGGEQLIFANSDLLSSRLQNFKRMQRRLVVFSLGVSDKTPAEKLAQLPAIVEEIIAAQENASFDRTHFKAFGDFALVFECAYYVEAPEFRTYMDTLHDINLALYQRLEREGIQLSYPTQTIYLER